MEDSWDVTPAAGAPPRIDPPDALFTGARHLTRIADLIEAADIDGARAALYAMPIEEAHRYWMNASTMPNHGPRDIGPETGSVREKVGNVAPRLRAAVGNRDRWHCRYCGLPVADAAFFSKVWAQLPAVFPRAPVSVANGWPIDRVFKMTADHVLPAAAGGRSTMTNLVTACGACNYQWKGDLTLDELGGALRGPVDPGWDGLVGRPLLL